MLPAPLPLFLEMFILKGFKSFVLEMFIPMGLWAHFLEVRIPKGLANWHANQNRGIRCRDPHM